MDLSISHTTRYVYDQPVSYALQRLHLRPADNRMQRVKDWEITVEGGRLELGYTDHHGNLTDLLTVDTGTTELSVTAHGTVETSDTAGILGPVYGIAPLWHFRRQTKMTEPDDRLRMLARDLEGKTDVAALHRLSAEILEAVPYETGTTYVGTTAQEALEGGRGVCQDHAHIFVSAVRLAGLPARYVSGYLKLNDSEEQTASHAWAEVHLDDLGWVGFDVSNRISPDERYVRLAVGLDSRDAAPVRGMRRGAGVETLSVSVQVQQ